MEAYDNLIDAINGLKAQGYTEDFNLKVNCLECGQNKLEVFHDEFVIDKSFRFEDKDSSTESASIIYAISSDTHRLKGVLISSYGVYADKLTNEMIRKLHFADE
jgi:hypothetical protein